MKRKYLIIAAAVLLVLLAVSALGFYGEYVQIKEIGDVYLKVFFTDIAAKAEMFAIVFAVSGALVLVNLLVTRRNVEKMCSEVPLLLKRKFVFAESGAAAFLCAFAFAENMYEKLLLCFNGVNAGIKDPIFGFDISYFLFNRDFWQSAGEKLLLTGMLTAAACAVIYVVCVCRENVLDIAALAKEKGAFLHFAINAVFWCVLKGVLYYVEAQGLVTGQSGTTAGAGFTDVNVRLPFYTIAPYLLFAIAFAATVLLMKKKFKATIVVIALFPVSLAVMNLVAAGVDLVYVRPNETTLEAKYIANNIKYTKIGFKLDGVEEREFPAEENLTREKLESNADIVNNIRITDPKSTEEVLNSTKSIRSYYTFNDSDIVEYEIDGKPTAVNIAARELDVEKLDANAKNYINSTFRYTHGYGITMNAVNSVNSEGQPDFVIGNMPIASKDGAPVVSEPRIYYGEKTNNYCIVNTKINEIDYPMNDDNAENKYAGKKSGIEMNLINRLVFSVKNLDYTMLVSGYINSDSRLLINRNIVRRVEKAVPFMHTDPDPYIVINDEGKLMWIVDLYTQSTQMPYSKMYGGVNYIRNSAKAVVDAYEGTVDMYVTDESDPIVMTYNRIYPSVMKLGGLPEDLAEHIRYPEYLFDLQSDVYLRYHVNEEEIFYANSDVWMRAKEKYRGEDAVDVEAYYNLLSVDDFGKDGAQLVLMMPFVPSDKENLVGWLAADSFGNMISYKFPAGRTVYGTLHFENRIDADAEISKELSLWNQGGSTVLRGNALVIPIEKSIIYVEPVYITTSNTAAVPEVKRIIMAYGDKIVMRETIEECFDEFFGQNDAETKGEIVPTENAPQKENEDDAKAEAVEAYDKMQSALDAKDWAKFGLAMEELDEAIAKLRVNE